jgi:hypothetical protein
MLELLRQRTLIHQTMSAKEKCLSRRKDRRAGKRGLREMMNLFRVPIVNLKPFLVIKSEQVVFGLN